MQQPIQPPKETPRQLMDRRVLEEDEPLDIEEVRRQLGLRLPIIADAAND
jgi:hypothetical protein